MYHKSMTIKKRLFFSNIRMVILSLVAFVLVGRTVMFFVHGTAKPDREAIASFFETSSQEMRMALGFLAMALFIILVSLMNNFLTHRMTKKITKPLEPLSEGVRQIYANNFAHRIDYQNDDEFRPVCDAFNEMAAKLEASAAQQKKDEANRRELIAGISHDLRTPLTSITGCIEGIETGVASTPEMQKQYHSFIKNEAANMKHIIEQLFLFSKLDMDEFPLDMMRIDITLAISEMIEDSLAGYESRGLSIHLAEMPKDVFTAADVRLFRNVITNILENSVKYRIKERGKMEISAAVENDHILLRFADDGPGVEADVLPKLMDVFYRANPSRTEHGSGLGLAVNAKIIKNMGGSIHAELPPAGGLAIVIRLPVLRGE